MGMEPKSREIVEMEEALRNDLRAMLKEELQGVDERKLAELESRIMSRASAHMCQRQAEG